MCCIIYYTMSMVSRLKEGVCVYSILYCPVSMVSSSEVCVCVCVCMFVCVCVCV